MIPITLVLCIVFVYQTVGPLTWIAIGIYLIMLIIQITTTCLSRKVRKNEMSAMDARVKLTNEVLTGIRVIKYYCWEKPFKRKIRDVRDTEVGYLRKMSWMMGLGFEVILQIVPQIVPLVCFALYPTVMKKPLVSSTAFTSLSLFGMLQMPFAMLPMVLMLLVNFT